MRWCIHYARNKGTNECSADKFILSTMDKNARVLVKKILKVFWNDNDAVIDLIFLKFILSSFNLFNLLNYFINIILLIFN